jgi:iron(III) transport system permease protein
MLFCMNDPIIPGMFLVSTYGTQVLIQYTALLDPAGAAALAVPMAAVGAAALAAALRLARRDWTGLDSPASDVRPVRRAAGQVIVAAVAAAVLAAALAVPIVALAYKAGSWGALADALVSARQQAWQTLVLALAAGAACMAAGAALAARWVGAWRAGRPTAVPLVLLNLTVPPSLLGIGVIQLAQAPPLEALGDTSWPLVLAYVARFLPVATLVCYALWRGEPREPVLAARVHGLSPWRTAWRVLWPMRRATIAAAGLLAALLVATELEVSILLAPPGGSTLGVRLYTLIHTAPETVTGALALDILLLAGPAILLLGLLLWLVRRPAAGEA